MNRIRSRKLATKSSPLGAKPQSDSSSGISAALIVRTTADESPHALFAPLHYERNYAYPLIVWLHGRSDDETQLKRVMPLVSLRNYVAIAPRGTAPSSVRFPATETSHADDEQSPSQAAVLPRFEWRQSESHIHLAEQRVLECLAAARSRFHVATDRVFLAGYDCGGTMALRLALREPRRFAGVLSLGGRFPVGHAPLARLAEARHLSIWLACTRASQHYPSEAVCDDLRLIHSAGLSVMLREYPGADGLPPQMLSDMDRWLMEQITGAGVSAVAPSAVSHPGSQ
jgi:phospholipase/carboxylesterase